MSVATSHERPDEANIRENTHDMDSFITDIGFDKVQLGAKMNAWKNHIRGNKGITLVSEEQLDRIYNIMTCPINPPFPWKTILIAVIATFTTSYIKKLSENSSWINFIYILAIYGTVVILGPQIALFLNFVLNIICIIAYPILGNHDALRSLSRVRRKRGTEAIHPYIWRNRCLYFRNLIVPLIHVRLMVVPSITVTSDIASSSPNYRSLEYLKNIFSDKQKLLKYGHTRWSQAVLECMMDLLEDISKMSIQDERVHSLVNMMIPFMGYYFVINEPEQWRDTTLLEAYLSEDGPLRLWSAVLLCLSKKDHAQMNLLSEYLENESLKTERISDDAAIVYAAALQSAADSDDRRTLTNTDCRLIIKMGECDTSLIDIRSTILVHIISIFIENYKEGIIKRVYEDSLLTDDQQIAINCLCPSLSCIRDDTLKDLGTMLNLLKELRPYVSNDIAMTRITKTILYELCHSKKDTLKSLTFKIHEVCHMYLSLQNVSEEIRLSSSMLICLNNKDYLTIDKIGSTIKYLSNIIDEMKLQGRENHLGFSLVELEIAATQLQEFRISIE